MARRPNKGGRKNRPSNRDMYWQTADYNEMLFQMFRDDLTQMALARFRWVGLPETCNARFLEWTLLREGCATLAVDPRKRLLSLKAVTQGTPNMYDEPRQWRAMGATGKTDFTCNWSNGVFIFENETRFPLTSKINIWARELADIIRTKQMNRFQMRIPLVVTAPQGRELDATNMYKQIAQGEPVIVGYDTMSDIETTPLMPQKAREYVGDKLDEEFRATYETALRELGIDVMPYKRERMIEDEAESEAMPTEITRLSPLACRRRALDKLYRRFPDMFDERPGVYWNTDTASDNFDFSHRYDALLKAGDNDETL